MHIFSLGGNQHERIEVEVFGYERAPVGDYYDDNWLRVRVSVSAGAFSGSYDASFLTGELFGFHDQLKTLYSTLRGEAVFSTLEEQLSLDLRGDGRGEIIVRGIAIDVLGDGNRLEFDLTLDQTYLQGTLEELRRILEVFPVR